MNMCSKLGIHIDINTIRSLDWKNIWL